MRRSRLSVLLLGSAFVAVALALLGSAMTSKPAEIRVLVVGCKVTNEVLLVSAVATNAGRGVVLYHCNPPASEVRWESPQGWTNMQPAYLSKWSSGGVLWPGDSLKYEFAISRSAGRFRVGCFFETPGLRGLVASALLRSGLWNRQTALSQRLVGLTPDTARRELECWSEETPVVVAQ